MVSQLQGTTLGPYRLIERIGQGGMATVYKAHQASMDRYVALKVLPPRYAEDPRFIERFNREARTIANLEHKNILPVYDFGESDGVTYLAMRYLEGGTLKEVLGLGRLTLRDVGEIFAQVCSALDYAHRRGVVHRDVKPANIMIDDEGAAYLTDFGIAKVLEGAGDLTETGAAIGTPAYMAPEQSLGQGVDGRSDIYAMGVILYEMIVGRAPFMADTPMAVALKHIHEPLPIPSQVAPGQVPDAVERVILKALAKDPADRYQTAAEMGSALRDGINQSGADLDASTLSVLLDDARTMNMTRRVPVPDTAPGKGTLPTPAPARVGRSVPLGIVAGIGGIALLALGAVVVLALFLTGVIGGGGSIGRDVELYDDFNEDQFEGSFNPDRWLLNENMGCTAGQEDGQLVFTTDPSGGACIIGLSESERYVNYEGVGFLQAEMEIDDRYQDRYEAVTTRLAIYTSALGGEWGMQCGLHADTSQTGVVAYFSIYNTAEGYDRQIAARDLPDGQYQMRIELDPETLEVTCYEGGDALGSLIPGEADLLREYGVFYRSINTDGLARVDEVALTTGASGPLPDAMVVDEAPDISPEDQPEVVDDFDNPDFIGSFDPHIWTSREENCAAAQNDGGHLELESDGWCWLVMGLPIETRPLNLVGTQSAEFFIPLDAVAANGQNTIQFTVYSDSLEEGGWSAACGFYGGPEGITAFLYEGVGEPQNIAQVDTTFDEFHTVSMSVDPETMLITCTLDGEVYVEYIPPRVDDLQDGDSFVMGIDARGLSLMDNYSYSTKNVPTLTPALYDPAALTIYDDFDDPAYDSTVNDSLWSGNSLSNECSVVQGDGQGYVLPGIVPASYEVRSCKLQPKQPLVLSRDELGVFEAQTMLTSDHNGERMIAWITIATDDGWSFTCGIFADAGYGTPVGGVGIHSDNWDGNNSIYDQREKSINYDRLITFTIVMEPGTGKTTCYVDGDPIFTWLPAPGRLDDAVLSRDVEFAMGENATGGLYLDNVRVGPAAAP